MGSKYEIFVWLTDPSGVGKWKIRYDCDTLEEAIAEMWRLKEKGFELLRLEWRP